MTSTPWNTSPVAETISELLELTDGLEIDGGLLEVKGSDGGFVDEFDGTTLNYSNWNASYGSDYIVTGGAITVPSYSNVSMNTRKLVSNIQTGFNSFMLEIKVKLPVARLRMYYGQILTSSNRNLFALYSNGQVTSYGVNKPVGYVTDYLYVRQCFNAKTGLITVYFSNDGITYEQVNLIAYSNVSNMFVGIDTFEISATDTIEYFKFYGYPTTGEATLPEAEAYSVDLPAKFAYAQSVTPNFPSIGAGGEIQFYAQHLNDWLPEWASLDDAFCDWTLVGTLSHGVALEFPEYITAPNEQLRYKLVYTGTGIVSYPTLDELEFAWISDVEAPSAPTVTIATQAGDSGATLQVNDTIPDGAYGCEVEVNINNAGYLPLSRRAELETGYDYLIFRGSISAEQLKGEINSLLWNVGGLAVSNTIQIKSRMVDNLLNRSAFTESDALIITAEALPPVNIPGVTTQSYAEEYAQIAKLLKDAWLEGDPASEITPILWDGVSADYPTDANGDRVNFIKMFITSGESDQISIGTPDRNIFRYSQMLVVKIYTLSQLGAIPALTLGDTFCSIFRNRNDAGIVFKSPRTISMGVNEDGYYQVNCFCPFDRDSFF